MYLKPLLAALVLSTATPATAAAPGDVSAHEFYTNALALKKKGVLAMVSGKLPAAKSQFKDAMTRVRDDNLAAKARGTPKYCPPEKGSITVDGLLGGLAAIPEPRRRTISLTDAWREILVSRYPCR